MYNNPSISSLRVHSDATCYVRNEIPRVAFNEIFPFFFFHLPSKNIDSQIPQSDSFVREKYPIVFPISIALNEPRDFSRQNAKSLVVRKTERAHTKGYVCWLKIYDRMGVLPSLRPTRPHENSIGSAAAVATL